jgi:hypothetical protein
MTGRKPRDPAPPGGYGAGVGQSLATAFPVGDCGSFKGLLRAIDKADRKRREERG